MPAPAPAPGPARRHANDPFTALTNARPQDASSDSAALSVDVTVERCALAVKEIATKLACTTDAECVRIMRDRIPAECTPPANFECVRRWSGDRPRTCEPRYACDPPYDVGSDGRKRYKARCL